MRFANIGLLAAVVALGFTGHTAAEPTMLSDDQIKNMIAGNTLSDGSKWAENAGWRARITPPPSL